MDKEIIEEFNKKVDNGDFESYDPIEDGMCTSWMEIEDFLTQALQKVRQDQIEKDAKIATTLYYGWQDRATMSLIEDKIRSQKT